METVQRREGLLTVWGDGMVCEGFREEVLPKQGFEG